MQPKFIANSIYLHYRGGLYTALTLVTHHDTRKPMVVYYSHEKKSVNCRPLEGWNPCQSSCPTDLDGWLDMVPANIPGLDTQMLQPRFMWMREATAEELKEARDARDCFQQPPDSE